MSATTTRLPRSEAVSLAWELVALLSPYCERIEVCGSIRRQRPTVGDIELLAVPKLEPITDLFGEPTGKVVDLLGDYCRALITGDVLSHRLDKHDRPAFGLKYKRLTYRGVALDLFSAIDPARWGVLQILRTGSADFSHRLVTRAEIHAFSQDGRDLGSGWLPIGMTCGDASLWRFTDHGYVRLETPDEESVFAAIGRDFVPPELREVSP